MFIFRNISILFKPLRKLEVFLKMVHVDKLVVNRSLVNPKFEGYKIKTDSTAVHKMSLEYQVLEKYSSLQNTSFLSSKMNTFVNSLVFSKNFYYFSEKGPSIIQIDPLFRADSKIVYQPPFTKLIFSPSLHFVNSKILIFNGANSLLVLNEDWNLEHSLEIGSCLVPKFIYSILLKDSCLTIASGSLSTIEKENKTRPVCNVNISSINIVSSCTKNHSFIFNDFPCSFEIITKESAIAIVNSSFREFIDIPKPVFEQIFTWSQDSQSLTIKFDREKLKNKNSNHEIKILFDKIIIDEEEYILVNNIDNESSRWISEGEIIEFTLFKKAEGFWNDVFVNNSCGLHLISPEEEQYNSELVQGLNRFTDTDHV